ncbi:MAG: hypothetical protein IV100_17800 [Myxococcales bacterium]|nr:hypothetical protein [Myxococcales bacterium]
MSTETTQTSSDSATGTAGAADSGSSNTQVDIPALVKAAVAEAMAATQQSTTQTEQKTDAGATNANDAETADQVAARIAALEARATKAAEQAKRAALASALPNLLNPDLLKLAPAIELTDDGALTADSARKLDTWKQAHPYYFRAASSGTTAPPGSTASGRGQMSAETQATLRRAGITPGEWEKKPGAHIARALAGGLS